MRTDDELVGLIEAEESAAINWADGILSEERAEAYRRYNCDLYGDETEGRSSVVSSDVRDAVEAVMPSMARIFLSGDEVGRFEPVSQEDKGAQPETDVCNWYIHTKNDGFSVIYNAIKESLLTGNAYVKTWWTKRQDVVAERYSGLSEEEFAAISQDGEVQVVEDEVRSVPVVAPDGSWLTAQVHDVKVERVVPDEYVAIAAVPPDEMLVSGTHREVGLANCDFVQHRRRITIGELSALGYDIPDNVNDETSSAGEEWGSAAEARNRYEETLIDSNSEDRSRRMVLFRETWIRLADGDSDRQTLWRVCLIGNTVLHKEEADLIPVASFVPIQYPHSHTGVSYFSLIADVARVKTVVMRQYLDNLYLINNSEKVVDINLIPNLDDFLVSRPGGIKRVDGPPANAVMPMITPDVGGQALQALEWLDAVKENRTGVARVNQGAMDPNSLNRTATGASLMMSAGQARLELMARCLSSGIKDLFLQVHAIAQKHSTKPMQIRLKNEWVAVNPREWVRRTDFALSVALGTGAPEQQLAKLTSVAQFMAPLHAAGLVTPENIYNLAVEYLRVAGYRSSEKFVTKPQPGQQTPQQQNPLLQVEQVKQQSLHALKDKELAFQAQQAGQETQQKAALEQQRMANEIAAQDKQAQADAALAQYKAQLDAETAIKLKLIDVAGQLLQQSMAPEPEEPGEEAEDGEDAGEQQGNTQMQQMMQMLIQTVHQLAAASGAGN